MSLSEKKKCQMCTEGKEVGGGRWCRSHCSSFLFPGRLHEPGWIHTGSAGSLQGLRGAYGLNLDLCCILNDLKERRGGCSEETKVLPPFTWLFLNSELANNGRVFGSNKTSGG